MSHHPHSLSLALPLCHCVAICDELGVGGTVVIRAALHPFQTHGLLSVHHLGLRHHRLQDAVPAQRRQTRGVLQQLYRGETHAYQRVPSLILANMDLNSYSFCLYRYHPISS